MAPPSSEGFREDDGVEGSGREESDGDLLIGGSDAENGVLQWLRAMDLQVLGACRADERLKPLLKLSVSSGVAEERLVLQLNQHFEASEVGMLARCLCIPLVSIRVGKVHKQGNLLCPTSTRTRRGHLNLQLLPSSNIQISFTGDDGCIERLANDSESSPVTIEEISADSSGRTFLVKLPGSQVSYFWCSERSKHHGIELLTKMKDLLRKKPSLSQLTGIHESRLDSFANHLRAYLLGSSNPTEATSTASSTTIASSLHTSDSDLHSSSTPSHSHPHPLYQVCLSPRSSTFNDVMSKSQRHPGDGNSILSTIPAPSINQCEDANSAGSVSRSSGASCSIPCCLPEIPCLSYPLPSHSLVKSYPSQCSITSPTVSPYYCWCPLYPSPLQYNMPNASTISLSLPTLSSQLFPEGSPDIAELPTLKLPSLFPETLVRVSLPSSQQIPMFTPFMSDPIVHVSMIDVCSAGQGYLVSAEPAISAAIPPLLPLPQTESVEMNARETLRMLMATAPTPTTPQLMTMLPHVLNNSRENFPFGHLSNHHTVMAGSRGFYGGTLDVEAITRGVLSSSRQNLAHCDPEKRTPLRNPAVSEGSDGPEIPGGASCSEGDCPDQQISD